jgi:glyoxylase-like metal-dependent hydrolase (beta-lactamase superfamily II)
MTKMRELQGNQELLPASLKAAQIKPEEVDIVINSHLHFDHCGWNTTLHPDGTVTPTFPNARYFAHAGEVAHGHKQYERDKVSYLSRKLRSPHRKRPDDITHQRIHRGEPQIIPGINVECFPGHTAQLMAIHIESAGQHACYISDLIPTAHHLDTTWCMGYDLDPMRVHRRTQAFLPARHPRKLARPLYPRPPNPHGPHHLKRKRQAGVGSILDVLYSSEYHYIRRDDSHGKSDLRNRSQPPVLPTP